MTSFKRKFYKVNGLNTIFTGFEEGTKYIYNTGINGFVPDLESAGIIDIDKHTILFITATENDEGNYVRIVYGNQEGGISESDYDYEDEDTVENLKYRDQILHKGDTMIWTRGDLYSISTQAVSKIVFDDNRNIIVTNTDGTTQKISQTESGLGYEGIFPIVVEGSQISIDGIDIDSNHNIIEYPESNTVLSGVKYTHVEGRSNTASKSYQHIQGKYSEQDNNSIFIIGGGSKNNDRKNLFVVGFDGVAHAFEDVTIGSDKNNPDCKLSDIHSVVDEDWSFIGFSQ